MDSKRPDRDANAQLTLAAQEARGLAKTLERWDPSLGREVPPEVLQSAEGISDILERAVQASSAHAELGGANFRIEDRPEADEAALRPVTDRLEMSQATEFQAACRQLLDTGRKKLIVDLCGFRTIPSIIIGAVLDTYTLAKGQELVLAADAGTADVFRKLFHSLIDIMEAPNKNSAEGERRENRAAEPDREEG